MSATPSPVAPQSPSAVELIGIDKRFGAVHANRDVSLAIAPGTIHGIVGENGAGKSTLMSILYGYYQADAGEIRIGGRSRSIRDSRDAIASGIGMVHQHFMLVEDFTVLENVVLGAEGGALLKRGLAQARRTLADLEARYSLKVDPDARIRDLSVGLQQRVEILKALYRGAEILILDEPTGVLTPQETDHLFAILRTLEQQGKTVILITHKLREIMAVTRRVTVMRAGAVVATVDTAATSQTELAEMMVGRKVLLDIARPASTPGEELLRVEDVTVADLNGIARVREVSFGLHRGEIVGIAGVAGNGQSELLETLAGMRPAASGRILLRGKPLGPGGDTMPRAMRRLGLAHVPEDRGRMGLVYPFHAWESAMLGYHDDPGCNGPVLLDRAAAAASCGAAMRRFDVRPPHPQLRTGALSGGNQQKLVLAREIGRDPDVLLVGQPTRGVDIGAIEFIHRQILSLRAAGKAILLVSVELDEILSLCDRILVMFDGRIVGSFRSGEATERGLGLLMAGVEGHA